jgi:hypothetical protein
MRDLVAKVLLVVSFALLFSSQVKAQNIASITGIVTDQTGAVIPGANVTLVNTATNVVYNAISNAEGAYTIVNVKPGPDYKITFSRDGFKPSILTNLYLNVSTTRTQNASLEVGGTSQTVEVSAASEAITLNTTDATVGNNYEVQMVNELPIQIRDTPRALFSMQPGATSSGAITGARTDQNNVTLDGLDVNDMATGQFGSVIGNAPVDSVQELRAVTSSPLAIAGQGGGGQFEMVTKSGSNKFHGNLFEYHRDTTMEANEWFNNNAKVRRAPLIRNQFGGNIGGPIKKDKAFFFFEYNGRRDNQGVQALRKVPLDSFRNGNISYIKNIANGTACAATSRANTTPQCIGTINSAQVAGIDPIHIGFDSALADFMNKRYPHVNDVTSGDGINTGGFRFNAPVQLTENGYVARVDYSLNNSMKVWARGSSVSLRQGDAVNFAAPIQFPGDPLSHLITNASYAYVVGHDWTIGSTKTNRFIYGETRSRLGFPAAYNPTGTIQYSNFGGNGSGSAILDLPYPSAVNAQNRVIPIPVIRDDFSWLKGNHTFQFGGLFKFINTRATTYLNYDRPSLGLGGNTNALNAKLRPSDIRTAGTTASNTYDSALALALGRFASVSSNYNYTSAGTVTPQGTGSTRQYRYYELEGYFGDTWKIRPSLTLSYGVRYSWYSVPYETNGIESVQDLSFNDFFDKRLAQSARGLSGNSSLPFITYTLGGKANHGAGYYDPSYNNFAPRFAFAYNPTFDPKTVISGSAGIVYDHTVVNAVQYQQDQYSYLFQNSATRPFGVSGDPVTSLTNDPRFSSISAIPGVPAAPVMTHPFQPYVSNGVPNGLINGQAFNESVDLHLRNPYSIVLGFGVQHEFPKSYIFKVNYAGRLGRRLLGQADANQLVDFPDTKSGQMMSTAFAAITQQVRAGADTTNLPAQAWFENVVAPGVGVKNGYPNNTSLLADFFTDMVYNGDFADFIQTLAASRIIAPNVGMGSQFSENTFYTNKGFSTYHGLLATLHKNLSQGLQFDLNYTWSHSIDNVSIIANQGAIGGYGFICDVVRPRECRGNSDFDQTQIITGNALYNLPFGRGQQFGATVPRWLDEVAGGWSISALPSWHTGSAFTAVSNAFVAGYANDAPAILVGGRGLVQSHAHKTATGSVNLFNDQTKAVAAFTGPVGFEIGTRNSLRAPSYVNLDLGVGKDFPLVAERLKLKFRADAFNSLNHANFSAPSFSAGQTDITSASSFGQITSTVKNDGYGARVLQLALRLEF